jgi:hypothetical protein
MKRKDLALMKAKANAYDCLNAYQPFHFFEGKVMVEISDPNKFARFIALIYRLHARNKNE